MQTYLNHLPNYLVMLCAMVGMMRWFRLGDPEKLILVVVVLNALVDQVAIYYDSDNPYNYLMYNLNTLTGHLISFIVYSMTLKKKAFRLVVSIAGILLLLFSGVNLTLIQGTDHLNTFTFIAGGILLVVASYYLLRTTIINREIDSNDLVLWFALANLVYSALAVPIVGLLPWLQELNPALSKFLFILINKVAYVLWTLLIMTGFLCKTRKTTFSL